MSREEWRSVVGYEGLYEVSDRGRVRSLDRVVRSGREHGSGVKRVRGTLIAAWTDEDGYQRLYLYRDGDGRQRGVHQLVTEAWHGPRPARKQVCHRNGDPADNRPENLRWGTSASNILDKREHGTMHSPGETCSRGHRLAEPNLTKERKCLACSRAAQYTRRRGGGEPEVQAEADARFQEIMSGTSWHRPIVGRRGLR